jgi:hypothetical protein
MRAKFGSKESIILGITRSGWDDNIKTDLKDIGFEDVDWINVAQDTDTWRLL